MLRKHTKAQFDAAKAELARRDLTLNYSAEYEEYRVNFKGGREATAYYTTSLQDAIQTGEAMSAVKRA